MSEQAFLFAGSMVRCVTLRSSNFQLADYVLSHRGRACGVGADLANRRFRRIESNTVARGGAERNAAARNGAVLDRNMQDLSRAPESRGSLLVVRRV